MLFKMINTPFGIVKRRDYDAIERAFDACMAMHSSLSKELSELRQENEELKEVAIGKELGVSRTPVREAFRQLELEGLIQIIPNKGAYVTGITPKDVHDIYMIRSTLEGMCARLATENITKEQLEELEEKLDELGLSYDEACLPDQTFHVQIVPGGDAG
jgi:DNA-binding GntR family transcriptional regulator